MSGIEFSRTHGVDHYPLDQRRRYWEKLATSSPPERVRFRGQWSCGLDTNGVKFNALIGTVISVLGATLTENGLAFAADTLDAMVDSLNRTEKIRVQRNYDTLTLLESQLVRLLRPLGVLDGITAMEFPSNIRVVHGRAPASYLKNPYPTDLLHSDLWSNEPNDIVNGVLYLGGDTEHTFMRLFEAGTAESDRIASFRGRYGDRPDLDRELQELDTQPEAGLLVMMDGVCPHQTCRLGGGVRLSLDFRLRRENPYGSLDERWMQTQQAFARYWHLNPGTVTSFAEKCRYERSLLNGLSLAARDRAIEALIGSHPT